MIPTSTIILPQLDRPTAQHSLLAMPLWLEITRHRATRRTAPVPQLRALSGPTHNIHQVGNFTATYIRKLTQQPSSTLPLHNIHQSHESVAGLKASPPSK